MLSLALWFLIGCGIAVFLFYLGSTILEIITLSFECILGDNGAFIGWSLLILGIIALVILL
jgi:hypothetical protein